MFQRLLGHKKNFGFKSNSIYPMTASFLSATGITDPTTITALNNLVKGLYAYGLISKVSVVYPFVGGNSDTCSYNLINTALYKIKFLGGWSFSNNGALSNGTNAYGKTGININLIASNSSNHGGDYIRNAFNGGFDFGASSDAGLTTEPYALTSQYTDTRYYFTSGNGAYPLMSPIGANARKFNLGTFDGSIGYIYKNSTLINSSASLGGTLSSSEIYLGAGNGNGAPVFYSRREFAYVTFGVYLTPSDVTNYGSLITNFQTELSRNV